MEFTSQIMDIQKLAEQFNAECEEAGLRVTWDNVTTADLEKVLEVTTDFEEALCELVQMFNHYYNF